MNASPTSPAAAACCARRGSRNSLPSPALPPSLQVGATYWSGQEPHFTGNVKVFKVRAREAAGQTFASAGGGSRKGPCPCDWACLQGWPARLLCMFHTWEHSLPAFKRRPACIKRTLHVGGLGQRRGPARLPGCSGASHSVSLRHSVDPWPLHRPCIAACTPGGMPAAAAASSSAVHALPLLLPSHLRSVINCAAQAAPAACEGEGEAAARAINIPTQLLAALESHAARHGR